MELRHVRYFIAVAEDLNFSRAAERLHVAQSALSRQIQDLEYEVGTPLFRREKPHIELTAAGRMLLQDARRIVAESQRAIEMARRAARGEVGELKLGYIAALSDGLIPRLLRRYRAEFPHVALSMTQMRPVHQVQALLRSEIDLGFIGLAVPDATNELAFHVFRRDPMCVALPSGHPLAHWTTVRLERFSKQPFIFLTRAGTPIYYDWLLRLCHHAGFHPQIAQEVEAGQTALELVAAGFGAALFSRTAHHCWHEDVVFRRLAGNLPQFEHCVAWRRRENLPTVAAFIQVLRRETGTESRQ